MQKLRDKHAALDRKKNTLTKHIEIMRSKDGKVNVAEHEIKELKRMIQ